MIVAIETPDFVRRVSASRQLGPMEFVLWAEIDLSAVRRAYPEGAHYEQVERFTRYRVELLHKGQSRELSPWQERSEAEAYIHGLQDGFALGRPPRPKGRSRR